MSQTKLSVDASIPAEPAPGPKNSPSALNLIRFRREPLSFLQRLTRQYGDFVTFRMGGQHMFLANNPEYIREVLVTRNSNFAKGRALQRAKRLLGQGLLTSEGELHRRQRLLVQPAFHRQRIASYGQVMVEHADRASSRWKDGETFDIGHEMTRLTLGIVAKTLFDAEVDSEADEIGEAMTCIMHMFNLLMYPFAELIEKLPLPQVRRYERMRARLDTTIYRIIDERRRSGEDRGDLLSILLLAQDEEGDRGGMSDTQVRDEALTLFLAGHETTANTLTWTWYLLSQYPEVEKKLHEELDEKLRGRLPTFEDIPQLVYTEKVVAESIRLFPPAWAIGRRSLVDQVIGNYFVPADAIVLLSPYVTHRDARFFPNPSRFDPERWTPEAKESRSQYSYFPFGGGPRRCIGEGFAWAEAILVLATLASRWQARLVAGQRIEPKALITLRPKHEIRMTVERAPRRGG
ncbi:MAG TPA: cytochrome P450 [Terriglobia bacterium]|nr:cytochrome P450 [Terriglobia bacterium]